MKRSQQNIYVMIKTGFEKEQRREKPKNLAAFISKNNLFG